MNERIQFFIKYKSLTIYSWKGDVCCVWEMSWRWGQTAILTPSSSSTIAALLSHLGWVAQLWVTEGRKALSLQAGSSRWHPVSNRLESPRALSYIIFWRPPAYAVLPLIYTDASLDWRFGRGSLYNIILASKYFVCNVIFKCATAHLFAHS